MNLKEIIKRTDKRILVLLVLLFFGVSYSVYRAIDALSADQTSPEYRRSPPGAFAVPATDVVIDKNKLEEIYLPDNIYVQVKSETDLILNKILGNNLTINDLTSYGLPQANAARFLVQIRELGINPKLLDIDPFFSVQVDLDPANFLVSASRSLVDSSGQAIWTFSFVYRVNSDSSIELSSLNI